ncbi:MAG: hypothetical protein MJK04_16545 [Psychrosphaera sp.]|nr:hypothetical protein [Psychrosphaera sp.]
MEFKKLKLKKAKLVELSTEVETLPREATDKVAGGRTTSHEFCSNMACETELFCDTDF